MARAPLPADLTFDPFFALKWDRDTESFIFATPHDPESSFDLGDYAPRASEQLQLRGLKRLFADRVVDSAREFGAVQAIPSQDRIVNLFPRAPESQLVSDMLTDAERNEGNSYVHLP